MKIVLSIASLLLSANLASAISLMDVAKQGVTYQSKGNWQSTRAEKGTWTATHAFTQVGDSVEYKSITLVQHGDQEYRMEDNLVLRELGTTGFYDIYAAGAKAGVGYCIDDLCHNQVTTDGMTHEETFHFNSDASGFGVAGSVSYLEKDGTEGRTAWLGSAVRSK